MTRPVAGPGGRRPAGKPAATEEKPPSTWRTSLASTIWGTCLVATGSLAIAGVWDAWTATFALLAAAMLPLLLLRAVLWLGVSRWAAALVLTLLLVLTAYLMTASTDGTLVESLADAIPRLLTEPLPYVSRADLLAAPVVLVALVSLLAGLRAGRAHPGRPGGRRARALPRRRAAERRRDRPARAARDAAGRPGPAGWIMLDRRPDDARRRIATGLPVVAGLAVLVAAVALVPVAQRLPAPRPRRPSGAQRRDAEPAPAAGRLGRQPGRRADAGARRCRPAPAGHAAHLRRRPVEGRHPLLTARVGGRAVAAGRRAAAPVDRHRRAVQPRRALAAHPRRPGRGQRPGRRRRPRDRHPLRRRGRLRDQLPGDRDRRCARPGAAARGDGAQLGPPHRRTCGSRSCRSRSATYAARITRDATSPYERALAIEHAVEHSRELSARATSGSAFWRIEQFLFGAPGTPGARVGTSEQFATAFALLARNAGLPTRIVVGFRPGEPAGRRDDAWCGAATRWPGRRCTSTGSAGSRSAPPRTTTPSPTAVRWWRPRRPPTPTPATPPYRTGRSPRAPSEDDSAAAAPATGTGAERPLRTTVAAAAGILAVAVPPPDAARCAGSAASATCGAVRREPGPSSSTPWSWPAPRPTSGSPRPWWPTTPTSGSAPAAPGRSPTRPSGRCSARRHRGPARPGSTATVREALHQVRRAARASVPPWRRWWWWLDPRVLRRR